MEIVAEKKLWIDTRLNEEEMNFLNGVIAASSEGQKSEDWKENAAGNVSRCDLIDKDNWFFETTLKKLTERMFYRDWDNFSKYHIEVEEGVSLPEFEMNKFWVNYQKQHDHVPIHNHTGLYSFVIFINIPTHWEDQHKVSKSSTDTAFTLSHASDFVFVLSQKDSENAIAFNFPLSPEDEGRMLFFPATLQHMVYPFYECEEDRVTISGNIVMYDPNRSKYPT